MGKYDKYFEKASYDKYKCRLCPSVLKNQWGGSTSHLRCHLRTKHPLVFKEIISEEENKKLQESFDINSRKRISNLQNLSELANDDTEHLFGSEVPSPNCSSPSLVNKALAQFLCAEGLSFSIIENDSFKNFVKKLSDRRAITDKTVLLSKILPSLYDDYKNNAMSLLDSIKSVALSVSQINSTFYIFCHFIDQEFNYKSLLLDSTKTEKYQFDRCLQEFNIPPEKIKSVVLFEPAVIDSLRHKNHYKSFSHTLEQGVKRIISNLCTIDELDELHRYFHLKNNLNNRAVPSDSGNGWMKFYTELSEKAANIDVTRPPNGSRNSENLKQYMMGKFRSVQTVLQPVYKAYHNATLQHPTLSTVIPTCRVMLKDINCIERAGMKDDLRETLNRMEGVLSCCLNESMTDAGTLIATMLDVRFKDSFFGSAQKEILIKEVKSRILFKEESLQNKEDSTDDDSYLNFIRKNLATTTKTETSLEESALQKAQAEVRDYLNIPPSSNSFDFWKSPECHLQYPTLSQMAIEYLAIPASVMAPFKESLFTDLMADPQTNNDDTIRKYTFLHFNIPMLGNL